MAQWLKKKKNLPANAGDGVQSLYQKDPLEKEMATHFSALAWEIPWPEEPGRLQWIGVTKELDTAKQLKQQQRDLYK